MTRTIAAAIFALLAVVTAPARAMMVDYVETEVESLDLNYPGPNTLTGNLGIVIGAPSINGYDPFADPTLFLNGLPLTTFGGGAADPGVLFVLNPQGPGVPGTITIPALFPGDPGYGNLSTSHRRKSTLVD
jgi:hypothetical protein